MFIRRLITYSLLSLVALGGFFGSVHIETDHQDNRVVSISYEGNGVYADTGTLAQRGYSTDPIPVPQSSAEQRKVWDTAIDTINMAFLILSTLVSPVILLAGWLMSPDWTSGDIFGLRTPMYTLWVTVSNIVYFIYAIMLILIALGTMFGKESFSYKVMLPKLALGILMVPFTWWFVQWTISLSSVVTASVMSIPSESIKESKWFTDTASIPKKITVSSTSTGGLENARKNCFNTPADCLTPKQFLSNAGGMYGPLIVYAYSVFNVHDITTLPVGLDMATAAVKIVHQSFIGMLMFLVFGLLVIALGAMLLVRAMKLWIYAIFSPLFTFQFVAGAGMMGGDKDTFTIKEFVGLCFVPAIVGMTLSFGLIMISAIQSTSGVPAGGSTGTCDLTSTDGCKIDIMGSTENSIIRRWTDGTAGATAGNKDYKTETTFKWGGMSWVFQGKAINQTTDATQSKATGTLDAVGGMFGTIIIDIIALVFIWMAFMAAKNVSKAVAMAVEPFEKIGKSVGDLAKSIPKYTPIPGLGMSANSMARVPESMQTALSTADNKRFEKSGIGKLLNADLNIPDAEAKKLAEALKAVGGPNGGANDIAMINKIMKEYGGRTNAYNSGAPEAFMETLKNKETREKFLRMNPTMSEANKNAMIKFATDHPNGLHSDEDKKALMSILNNAFGSAAGASDGTGTSGTTRPNQNGDGTISLGGINVNYNGANLSKHDELASKIITGVTSKASTMHKPTLDEIKKELENIGLAEKVEDVAKKIETGIDKLSFKPKA